MAIAEGQISSYEKKLQMLGYVRLLCVHFALQIIGPFIAYKHGKKCI